MAGVPLSPGRVRATSLMFAVLLYATSSDASQTALRIAGSSTVKPVADAWRNAQPIASSYAVTLEGGGSSSGARRVCLPRTDPLHVDIGDMSREWKSKEATLLDDGYTYECMSTQIRVTQLAVGVDGLAVVAAKNSAAHDCITSPALGGLTIAQLRWMFTDLSDEKLSTEFGLDMLSVAPNNDFDGIKEWSDLHEGCAEVPIQPYGAGDQSGTHDFFAEVVIGKHFGSAEGFPSCNSSLQHSLEALNDTVAIQSFLNNHRPDNCYMSSEDDENILHWVLADTGGIGYFGFAYYTQYSALLTVVRISDDKVKGAQDTLNAKIEPSAYSITDGSYSVFRRMLYMNVDNEAWPIAHDYLDYGFTDAGQAQVSKVGYVVVNANLKNKMQQRIEERGNAKADYVPVKPDRCWNGTELFSSTFKNRFNVEKIAYSCEQCPIGRSKRFNTPTACLPCIAGTFAETVGQSACRFCDSGSYSNESASSCTPCPKNAMAQSPGQKTCDECALGFYTSAVGATECMRCLQGTYRSATDTSCMVCPDGMTTAFQAASAASDCVCKERFFRPLGRDACQPCPEGMLCSTGSDMRHFESFKQNTIPSEDAELVHFPLLKSGYYSSLSEPLSVFRCLNTDHCPGGVPGTCPGGLGGLLCASCPQGQYLKNGVCTVCESNLTPLLMIPMLIIGSLGLAVLHVLGNWPMAKGKKQVMMAAFFVGMAITVVLTFGVYGTLDAIWGPPLNTFIPSFNVFRMDLEVFNFSCLIGGKSYVASYVVKLLAYPICLALLVGSASVLNAIPQTRKFASFNVPSFLNSGGFVLSAFFVSVSLMSLEGFRCASNPNGRSTLMADESIICWEGGGHTVILALSALAILIFPVFFISLTGFVTLRFGQLSVTHGLSFTRSVRFLTARMRPECEIFGFWFNVRNFGLSLAPVLATNNYGAQVCLMTTIFLVWLVMQTKFQCWRFEPLNGLDTLVSAAQIILLALFGLLGAESVSVEMVGWCIIVLLMAIVLLLATTAAWKIISHLRPTKPYDIFLTHHKAAAALSARHLKTLLLRCSSNNLKVFLDVDELDNLDNLQFAVKRTRKLIIMLTSEVLRRPWCAVEIGTAFLNQVPLGVVQVNEDAVELDKIFLSATIESFTEGDCAIFAKNGLFIDDLIKAYEYVAGLEKVVLPLSMPDESVQLDACRQAVGQQVSISATSQALAMDPEKLLYIVYNTGDNLQASVAYLLFHLFREHRWDARMLSASRASEPLESRAVSIVLMSKGMIQDPVALGSIISIKRMGLGAVTVLSQESFFKPSDKFFESLEDERGLTHELRNAIEERAPGFSGQELVSALMPLYKILAWSFSPEQNSGALNQEFSIIQKRATGELEQQCLRLEKGEVSIGRLTLPERVTESRPEMLQELEDVATLPKIEDMPSKGGNTLPEEAIMAESF
eukprot:TRINITY_DN6488_c0_g1_i1.p1 TRINITY_DN6488_c0_g1~~TRINITY_DN6488_c0_g1_i1.p1  ORF type:complete len:1425 (+),score=232.44 TRINITY_DN6488_c0_g1_i1:107-4381(+)